MKIDFHHINTKWEVADVADDTALPAESVSKILYIVEHVNGNNRICEIDVDMKTKINK